VARHLHRLTASAVANLKAKGLHPDGGGLYVRVTGNATKSWIFRYTSAGSTRDMGLGAYPTVTLARNWPLSVDASVKTGATRSRQEQASELQRHLKGFEPRHSKLAPSNSSHRTRSAGVTPSIAKNGDVRSLPMCTHRLEMSPWATSPQNTSFRRYNQFGRRRRKLRAGCVDASRQFSHLPRQAACG